MTVRPYIRTSVRPSVRTTGLPIHFLHWIESCAESRVFSARNRMLTRVVAKQAKTTKVKNKFVSGKKKFKRTLSCLFGGRGKVQSRRKKFGDKVQAKSSNLPRRFCSNSVGTPLEFAAFRSGFDAKYSRASAFCFFCPQPWFLRRFEHILPGKTPAFSCWCFFLFYLRIQCQRPWPSGLVPGISRRRAGFDTQREQEFFPFFFFFFFL